MVILLVEDDDIIRENVFDELAEAGFDVLAAETGEQAVRLIESNDDIEALFTDIRMPGRLDGWKVAEAFRAKRPDGHVLYASGYSVKHTPVSNSLFFRKPYRLQQVIWGLRALAGAASVTGGTEPASPGWMVAPKLLPEPEIQPTVEREDHAEGAQAPSDPGGSGTTGTGWWFEGQRLNRSEPLTSSNSRRSLQTDGPRIMDVDQHGPVAAVRLSKSQVEVRLAVIGPSASGEATMNVELS